MIKMEFVRQMETTERVAKNFFECNPSIISPDELIKLAEQKGLFNDLDIDADLFRHLMKKYTAIGY